MPLDLDEIERLAKSPLPSDPAIQDYFLDRLGPALGIEEVPPSPRLADLLDQVAHLLNHFSRLPNPNLAVLIACWIGLTYCYELFRYCGFLALRSATPRCGKTRLLRSVALTAFESPKIQPTPTPAVLFRRKGKVLILDEVDKLRNTDKENFGLVMAILNVSFEAGAMVERTEKTKDGFEVKEYPVYRPVALAGIEGLADTLADRAFQIQMERTPARMPRYHILAKDQAARLTALLHDQPVRPCVLEDRFSMVAASVTLIKHDAPYRVEAWLSSRIATAR